MLLDIGPGDEVIVPAMTFCSTAHAVRYVGATPVIVDVDPETLCIDPAAVGRAYNLKTAAVIAVHYGGRVADMAGVYAAVSHGGAAIIEDCAHACGTRHNGYKAGSLGDIGCFSFHAVKNLACGDGGMITTNDPDMAERARRLTWLGIDKGTHERTTEARYSWEYDISEIGLKAHMNDITAAIGLEQLRALDGHNRLRRAMAWWYGQALPAAVNRPQLDPLSAFHLYPIQVDSRDEVAAHLAEQGIATGVHYKPLHRYGVYYGQTGPGGCPNADAAFKRILSLPMYVGLTYADVDRVCKAIAEVV